ncbi:MAG TPA: hypothetical protein VL357_05750 [Rariglobus sp.]|jgi:hypothetical protein|nr:hypothetical protein [Rariglobus sp.]
MKKSLFKLSLAVLGLVTFFSITGCNSASKKKNYEPTAARFFMEATDGDAFASAVLPISGVRVAVNAKPIITEFDIVHVDVSRSDLGQFLVFQLTAAASRDLYRKTGENQGKRLVLAINGRPLGTRPIDHPFGAGSIAMFVEVPDDQLPALVKNLNATSEDIQEQIAKQG